jgi:hypothetical protein
MDGNAMLVRDILTLFGNFATAAKVLKTPPGTVYRWVAVGEIPYWRRAEALKALRSRRKPITEAMQAYLTSNERRPKFDSGTIIEEGLRV